MCRSARSTSVAPILPDPVGLFLIVRGVDVVFAEAQGKGVQITRGIKQESWGARAFQLTDPSGNLILVAEEITA